MRWDVTEVKPLGNRTLAVKFADGLVGTFCLTPSYCTGVFSALLEDGLLNQATVQYGVVAWPNGLDLAPDTLYKEILYSPTRHYEVGQHRADQVGAGPG